MEPRKTAVCRCTVFHRPRVHELNAHHIVPKAWGGGNTTDNKVWLCPNAHAAAHVLLNAYVRAGGPPPWSYQRGFPKLVRDVCAVAWAKRPTGRLPYTAAHPVQDQPDVVE